MTIFALTGAVLAGAMVFVVMKVHNYGESQTLVDQLLKAQTETATIQKKLLGYTKYADYLEASRQSVADLLKAPVLSVTRDYVQVEELSLDKHLIKADATVIVRYAVEFALALDVSPTALSVSELPNGVSLKMGRPSVVGTPKIKIQSHAVVSPLGLIDKNATLAELQSKFAYQVNAYGSSLCTEEVVRVACKMKVLEMLRDALGKQSGVTHVPAVFVEMR
ncbi:hypothetical protein [Rhodoferax sp.]|uniref:hypothetical protein n=1 Tax=Rhodoferax sp. TaxID=50421 RepID=UPI002850D0FD|nr:hypothetical protein [Rhodoferax sp.]MDR3370620.1 hypothetical protein [Rhodoferax sp.]